MKDVDFATLGTIAAALLLAMTTVIGFFVKKGTDRQASRDAAEKAVADRKAVADQAIADREAKRAQEVYDQMQQDLAATRTEVRGLQDDLSKARTDLTRQQEEMTRLWTQFSAVRRELDAAEAHIAAVHRWDDGGRSGVMPKRSAL